MIEITNVTLEYDTPNGKVLAVENASFSFVEVETVIDGCSRGAPCAGGAPARTAAAAATRQQASERNVGKAVTLRDEPRRPR